MKHKFNFHMLFVFVVLVAAIFAFSGQVLAETLVQKTPTAVVNASALNVRAGPSVSYEAVAVVYQGHTVTLIGRNQAATWAKVRLSNNREGWVNVSLISPNVAMSGLPIMETPVLTLTATVVTASLNVRSGPGVVYDVLTTISSGQQVILLGRNGIGSWVKIKLPSNQEGWVNALFMATNVSVNSLAVTDAPDPPNPALPVAPNAQLSLRAGPSLNNSVVGLVYQGQRVNAIGRNSANTWVKVRVLETALEGWIEFGFLQLNLPTGDLPLADGSAASSSGASAVIVTGALNMRTGPGIGYGVVAPVYNGNTVILLGRNAAGSWVKVRSHAGKEGWANVDFISPNVAISTLPVLDTPTLTAVGIVDTGGLSVRSGPGIENSVTAVIYRGETVGLLGRNPAGSWVKVQLGNGHIGWSNASYLDANVSIANLAIVQ